MRDIDDKEINKSQFVKKKMNMKYEIKPLTEEEETFIEEKINVYADSMAPSEPHTEEEQLVFKILGQGFSVIQSPRGIALFSIVL